MTTGENESGYERSLRFLQAAKANGYYMVYKAYPGLGHHDSAPACRLACACFQYWLAQDVAKQQNRGEWPFVVDVVNQVCYSREREKDVPAGFRLYLPNEKVAKAWRSQ